MEIGWSSSDRPRFKVRVLDEGYALIPELPRDIAHASRGRETSYSGLFSIYESFWSCLSPRGCLVGLSSAKKEKKKTCFLGFWDERIDRKVVRLDVTTSNLERRGTGRPVGLPEGRSFRCSSCQLLYKRETVDRLGKKRSTGSVNSVFQDLF